MKFGCYLIHFNEKRQLEYNSLLLIIFYKFTSQLSWWRDSSIPVK